MFKNSLKKLLGKKHKFAKTYMLLKKRRFDIILNKLCMFLGIQGVTPFYPIALVIEPTNFCNLRCFACPTGSGKLNRPKRMMSFEEFKKIIDQSKRYITNIALWNYGEPFMNKELLKMMKYATSSGIYIITSTNGHFLNSIEFCRDVVKSGLQHLIICLDGADQETLIKYRRGANFNKIVKGIELMRKAKNELSSKTPLIELQFILMKDNVHQRKKIKEIANQLGVDLYTEKKACLYSNPNDPDFQKFSKKILPKDITFRNYIKKDKIYVLKRKLADFCDRIYESTVINSDGSVVPCCYDIYSNHIMGNVFKEDLKTIWKNKKYKLFRKKIKKNIDSIPVCLYCDARVLC